MTNYASLPGYELIVCGIDDLQNQRETIPALLVAIGAPKLRSLGIELPDDLPDNRNIASTICYPQLTLIQPIPDTTP